MIIYINDKKIKVNKGQTILEVARENKIDIPTLCHHSDLKGKAGCRICMVEVKADTCLYPACKTKVKEGMKILTHSPLVKKTRKTNLELLFAQHKEECFDCVYNYNCQLLKLSKEYKVKIDRFIDRKTNFPVYNFGPSLLFDSKKCIDCGNCIEVCQKQSVCHLARRERKTFNQIEPVKNNACIYCGQCITHCPVGAFEAIGEFEDIEKPLNHKDKIVIFQIAPSIRTSIGEEFDMKPGQIVTEKIAAGVKKLGVDYVFDVSVGADFTTFEEAKELVAKMKKGKDFNLFTSCCPAWVRFVETRNKKFVKNLTIARSPHIISGGLIKTYFADKKKIKPENIVVVSVMPCVAKKYEITRKEIKIGNLKPVDYVLTTRELARLFIKNKIDLKKIKPGKLDNPLGSASGAGVIYGASGGVMESALRTTMATLDKGKPKIEFKEIRGLKGCRSAEVVANGKKIKIAIINGTGNAQKILDILKKDPKAYQYIEVMACPGGCIGGGGQPVPSDREIRKQRAESLYKIDKSKKMRLAHQNPIIKKVYKEFLTNQNIIKKICHAKYE